MSVFWWILLSGLLMSAIAFCGALALVLREKVLKRILLRLVAFSAGTLFGGAFFHMLPEALTHMGDEFSVLFWCAIGFIAFLFLEQGLHWHHCHRTPSEHRHPVTHLILIADGIHNLLGGLTVGAAFVIDIQLGIVTWLVAAAHEIPQELGDFGILIHGGWEKRKALLFNFYSALAFPVGGVAAFFLSGHVSIDFLLPFAAGNFIYIAATDLVPEITVEAGKKTSLYNIAFFLAGAALLLALKTLLHHHPHGAL